LTNLVAWVIRALLKLNEVVLILSETTKDHSTNHRLGNHIKDDGHWPKLSPNFLNLFDGLDLILLFKVLVATLFWRILFPCGVFFLKFSLEVRIVHSVPKESGDGT
jgi:hypothetical protein